MSFEMDRRNFLRLLRDGALFVGAASLAVACRDDAEKNSSPAKTSSTTSEMQMSEKRMNEIKEAAQQKRQEINKFVNENAPSLAFLADISDDLTQQEKYDREIGTLVEEQEGELKRTVAIGKFSDQLPEREGIFATISYQVTTDGKPREIVDFLLLHRPGVNYYFYPSDSNDGRAFAQIETTENGELVRRHTGEFNPDQLIDSEAFKDAVQDLNSLNELVDEAISGGKSVVEELENRLG